MSPKVHAAIEELETRLRIILPEEYQDNQAEPISMGSAGLKFDSDGKVAWDEIWDHFCDLAMAGGPPHKGRLLEPGSVEDADRYRQVTEEICRGIGMVTELSAGPTSVPGWVFVDCEDEGMAAWLVRAIVMENVSVHIEGAVIFLPAGAEYRLEKEIKNVVTAVAKTSHYWIGHMWKGQHREITSLFARMEREQPLIQPARVDHPELADKIADDVERTTGLRRSDRRYAGWLGVDCLNIHAAIWMMRAIVASNILARREETILFLPVNEESDPAGEVVVEILQRVLSYAKAQNVI